jgi:hypothetical protein
MKTTEDGLALCEKKKKKVLTQIPISTPHFKAREK